MFKSTMPAAVMLLCAVSAFSQSKSAVHMDYGYGYFGQKFDFGSELTEDEIKGWDTDVRYDGQGAPKGSGSVGDGEPLYERKCASCHGTFGEGEGRWPKLSGGAGTLTHQQTSRPEKTVGSYWPYAGTLLDYIYRAMPYTEPKSLTPNEAYAVTAYVLYLNEIVEDDFVLDRETLRSIVMPNAENFIPDPRPDTQNTLCMKNCKSPEDITLLEHIKGVTPDAHLNQSMTDEPGDSEEIPDQEEIILSPNALAGMKNYGGKCSVCHQNGVGGAPKIGPETKGDWTKRYAQGMDVVLKHVIEGYEGENGVMPPKGGFTDLSDSQIRETVLYMMESSGVKP